MLTLPFANTQHILAQKSSRAKIGFSTAVTSLLQTTDSAAAVHQLCAALVLSFRQETCHGVKLSPTAAKKDYQDMDRICHGALWPKYGTHSTH